MAATNPDAKTSSENSEVNHKNGKIATLSNISQTEQANSSNVELFPGEGRTCGDQVDGLNQGVSGDATSKQDCNSELRDSSDIDNLIFPNLNKTQAQKKKQRLVKELKEKELDSISPGLDEIGPGSLSPKIHYIIEKKFKDQPEKRKEKLRGLYKSGWEFLSQLLASHSNVTRAQFCKVAKDLNRVDIKDFLEEKLTSDDSKLNDLELDAKASLASYLSKTGPAINGWLHFADEYNFTSQQKTAIENVDKEKDTKSFSRLLLKHDDEFKVMTLEELKGICDDLDFKDIANTLDNMMAK